VIDRRNLLLLLFLILFLFLFCTVVAEFNLVKKIPNFATPSIVQVAAVVGGDLACNFETRYSLSHREFDVCLF
jgi:hypothetical protein